MQAPNRNIAVIRSKWRDSVSECDVTRYGPVRTWRNHMVLLYYQCYFHKNRLFTDMFRGQTGPPAYITYPVFLAGHPAPYAWVVVNHGENIDDVVRRHTQGCVDHVFDARAGTVTVDPTTFRADALVARARTAPAHSRRPKKPAASTQIADIPMSATSSTGVGSMIAGVRMTKPRGGRRAAAPAEAAQPDLATVPNGITPHHPPERVHAREAVGSRRRCVGSRPPGLVPIDTAEPHASLEPVEPARSGGAGAERRIHLHALTRPDIAPGVQAQSQLVVAMQEQMRRSNEMSDMPALIPASSASKGKTRPSGSTAV